MLYLVNRLFKKLHKNKKGSFTVEAAIVVPISFCVFITIVYMMKFAYTQNVVQDAINETATKISKYSYVCSVTGLKSSYDNTKSNLDNKANSFSVSLKETTDAMKGLSEIGGNVEGSLDSGVDIDGLKQIFSKGTSDANTIKTTAQNILKNPKSEFMNFASFVASGALNNLEDKISGMLVKSMTKSYFVQGATSADERLKRMGINAGYDGLDFSDSTIFADANKRDIDIIVKYKIKIPAPLKVLPEFNVIQRITVRAWLDGDGSLPAINVDTANGKVSQTQRPKAPEKEVDKSGLRKKTLHSGDPVDNKETGKTKLTRSQLGESLGTGGNKEVFAFGADKAVGILMASKNSKLLTDELELLKKLDDLGLPTVKADLIEVDGNPALMFDRFEKGSKDVVKLVDGKIKTIGESQLLNQKSIDDLMKIKRTLIDKKIKIDDLQFLIGKDGKVVIADPLKVTVGSPPSSNNTKMIDQLIEVAKKNK